MNTNSHRTAILVFSQSGYIDARSKHFLGGSNYVLNKEFCDKLVVDTRQLVDETGLDYFTVDEKLQVGKTFGERLEHAFQLVFDKGFNDVICVGSDCPNLSKTDILTAQRSLKQGHVAIGPNKRGGVYLLGLTREQFSSTRLSSFSWQSSCLFNELISHWKSKKVILGRKTDLNTKSDIKRLDSSSLAVVQLIAFIEKISKQLITQYRTAPTAWSKRRIQYAYVGLRAP